MLEHYFHPIAISDLDMATPNAHFKEFPSLQNVEVVLIGLDENANEIRNHFYHLSWKFSNLKWADLGDLKNDGRKENIEAGLREMLFDLFESNASVFPIILGGKEDYSEVIYHVMAKHKREIEYCKIATGLELTEDNPVYKIIMAEPNKLFNFTLLGTQTYYFPLETEAKLKELYFDNCRLGAIRNSIFNAEPAMRNAQLVTVDMKAMKSREFDASGFVSPNGFYSDEICQIMRFAGMSCNLEFLYLHGFNNLKNLTNSAALLAQMIWFVFNGRAERIYDIPDKKNKSFTTYRNTLNKGAHEIVFCKSNKTERWWMEIPNPKTNTPFYVACTYNDFLKVSNDEMPDRWWQFYQKVM